MDALAPHARRPMRLPLVTRLEHRTLMLTRWRNRNVGRSSNIGLA